MSKLNLEAAVPKKIGAMEASPILKKMQSLRNRKMSRETFFRKVKFTEPRKYLMIPGDDKLIGGGVLLYVRDRTTSKVIPVDYNSDNNRPVFHTVRGNSYMAYLELFLDGANNTGEVGGFLSVEFTATGSDDISFYVNSKNIGLFVNGIARESNIIWRSNSGTPESRRGHRRRNYLEYGGNGYVLQFLVAGPDYFLTIPKGKELIGGGAILYVRDISIPGDGTNNQTHAVLLDFKNNRAFFRTVRGHSCIAYLEFSFDGANNTGQAGGFLAVEFTATGSDDILFYFDAENTGLYVNGVIHESNVIWRSDGCTPESRAAWREKNYLLYGGDGYVVRIIVE